MKETNNSGLSYLYRNRKLLILALLIGAISGGVMTFFIPKKYLATAIVYPYNSHTRDNLATNPQFGYEIETEQLMQLLETQSMRDRTVDHFKLYDYYGIDTNKKTWKSELTRRYVADVDILRSKYLSVIINVKMEDPELAADIANFQVEEVDRYRASIFEDNRKQELKALETEYFDCQKQMNRLRDSIYALSKGNGILYNFVENLNNENYDPSDFVTTTEMEDVVSRYVYEDARFKSLRQKYDDMRKMLEVPLPSVYSIDRASPSYYKVSPSLSLNVLIGAMLVFIMSLTIKLVVDKWRQLRNENS